MKCPKFAHKILATALLAGISVTASAQMMINGAGATFPYPIYSKWFDEYAKVDPSVRFNYQSIGSGGGQKQILAQTVDFGASDGPMSDENLGKAPGKILHIPTVAGAVVLTYNLPGNIALKLDGDTIAGIFLGQIKKWNDPKLTALNSGANLPDQEIVVVHRSDGSGTSFIFTDYLSKVSSKWKEKVGNNTSVNWPAGIGGKGNEGVSGQVKQTPGAIGYVELIYAIQNKMPYAEVKNSAGQFVKPTIDSVTAAVATANIPDDFRFSMTNAPGKDAYPICGATWLLVYQQQKDATKGKKLVEFLKWAMKDGEKMAKDLDYASLPESVQQRVLKRIDEIKCNLARGMEAATAITRGEPLTAVAAMTKPSRFGDKAFEWLTLAMALTVLALVILVGWQLWNGSVLAVKKFGFHFLTTSTWDPVADEFGALPFIYGTLVSSLIALLIAVPLSIATAAYLTELAPLWIRQPLVSLIEMLAAIPSVILGLWGIFVMIPWLRDYPFPLLKRLFGWTPFFTGPIYGPSMLAGGIIIAVMILPIVTSVSREILRSVPDLQREAAYGLGATRWEATRIAVLSYAKKGLFGAVILGLGRALGETMAVTMVIGNTPQIAASLFKPGYTLASVLANEFTEATSDLYLQALFEIGLVLFGITILVNLLAQLLLRTITVKSATRAVQ